MACKVMVVARTLLAYLFLSTLWSSHCVAQELVAKLDYGTFQGTYSSRYNISYWRKIPFAAPPVGENRFRAPQPPLLITNGTYNSDQSYDFCPQRTVCHPSVPNVTLRLTCKLGKWHRRLPLPRSLLPPMESFTTTPPSCCRLLWRCFYSRRRLFQHLSLIHI